MIKLWLDPRGSSLYYPIYNRSDRMLSDGTIILSSIEWYDRLIDVLGDIKIDRSFLDKGFKI